MGYSDYEFSRTNLFEFLIPEDRPRAIENIQKSLKGEKSISNEYTVLKKDGTTFPVMMFTEFTSAIDGSRGLRGIVVNISEAKKADQKLAMANEKLRVVGSLTRHDVRNKLSIIKGNTHLLRKKIGNNPDLTKYLDSLDCGVDLAVRILEFSRLYEIIGAEDLANIEVKKCFNNALALFPNLGNVKVSNECEGLTVVADSLLSQLLYNLVDNSLKHGERVTQIRLHYTIESNQIKLFYEDDGVGVPQDNKAKLFVEGFTTGKGTGMGLALVKKMVEVYGWNIAEEGKPGQGAKFVITIPTEAITAKQKNS